MTENTPPKKLPKGFREVWDALREADERASSRQVLASQLGVSTHTIQRILVDGDVPSFPETRNTRIVHAWVRILTRLAVRLDREPREWIEMAGIAWVDDIPKVSDSALRRASRPKPQRDIVPQLYDPLWDIQDRAKRNMIPHVRIGLVSYGPFSSPLRSLPASFLNVYATRLLGAIEPAWKSGIQFMEDSEIRTELAKSPPTVHLGLGLLETVHRRRRGLDFLPIPGWRVRLSAASIRRRGENRTPPDWTSAISSSNAGSHEFMVLEGDIAHHFLVGQCGIPAEKLLFRSASGPEDLAATFLKEARRQPERWILLVCDEETCRRTTHMLGRTEGFGEEFVVEEIPGAPEECPSYPLSVAFRGGSPAWRDLLRAATELELFANSYRQTAQLYAELMAAGLFRAIPGQLPSPSDLRAIWRPAHFRLASREFQETLCRQLIGSLQGELASKLRAAGDETSGSGIEGRARMLAVGYAGSLIPEEWKPSLVRAHEGEEGGILHCQSCSQSLLDEHNRGVSHRYCRYCADETGHLKPRDEVQHLIAQWFQHWQGDLSDDEAMRRAELYMRALPAWAKN
jgi:hypothetical protein